MSVRCNLCQLPFDDEHAQEIQAYAKKNIVGYEPGKFRCTRHWTDEERERWYDTLR